MSEVVCDITISLDGYAAGPEQSREDPLGKGGEGLHTWMFETPEENRAELDGILSAGAYIMGRNMFGPIRGEWDVDWTGWWGDEPPYHGPVFVLTHYPREPLTMAGGTTFTFVTDGIESALDQARDAAGEANVAIAGGPSTVDQYLSAGLLDELRLHVTPILLGGGERLFARVPALRLRPTSARSASLVTHAVYRIPRAS
ncbi:dihydrofolate reductase family protein [Amycolatopsis pithecellobii]|uniref:Dihydrofolate reductase n=1 Tax=Amycolatopsis pithecellobii TaxID=664692 RepID=A0A6N7Z9F8_9PSEU|nr:dihydrofolate reductase family protein [Amycolatopsis pithecellobii]MTD58364.1 dihydrofolate reductase [Amycolatopsis pithecellobii]